MIVTGNEVRIAKEKLKDSFERLMLKLEIQLDKVERTLDVKWSRWKEDSAALGKLTPPELPKDFVIDIKTERLRMKLTTQIAEICDHIATTDYTLTINEEDEKAILAHLEAKVASLTT